MNKNIIFKILIIAFVSIGVLTTISVSRKSKSNLENESSDKNNVNTEVKSYTFDKIGISFSAPIDMTVNGGVSQDGIFTVTVQRGKYPDQNYYQLYGILQETADPTFNTESVKTDLQKGAQETTIGGAKAVQGQYKGERNNLVTFIFTNKGIFKLATNPPTSESEEITNNILATLKFSFLNNPVTPSPTTEEEIRSILAKKYNRPELEVKVTVNKEVQGYATGSVLFGQGGPGEVGMWLAVMGNGWEVVWDGNGNVDCNKMRQVYGIPDTILKPNLCD